MAKFSDLPYTDETITEMRRKANFCDFNAQTSDYTIQTTDWGKWLKVTSGSDVDITVPVDIFPAGGAIPVVRMGSGAVTIVPAVGVTIHSDGEDNSIPSQYKTALLVQVSTNTWLLQGIGSTGSSSGGGDGSAPTVTSATATDANTIQIVFNEAVTGTTAGWSFNNGGALTIASRSGSGTNTWDFTITETMDAGDTITRTYNSGTGDAVDGASNELASFTGSSVTNSIVDDAEEFFTATGITDPTIQGAVSDLVDDLKTASIWNKLHAIYPLVGGTATTHKYNLKDPQDSDAAFRLTFAGTHTHNSNGVTPTSGTGNYADTHFVPNSQFSTSASLGFYSRSNFTTDEQLLGAYQVTDDAFQISQYDDFGYFQVGNTEIAEPIAPSNWSRLLVASRVSTAVERYRDGTSFDTATSTFDKTCPNSIFLFGRNNGSGSDSPCSIACSFAFIGDGLSDAEVSALNTAVNAFQAALSRNV
jgi:hypothetical protein